MCIEVIKLAKNQQQIYFSTSPNMVIGRLSFENDRQAQQATEQRYPDFKHVNYTKTAKSI